MQLYRRLRAAHVDPALPVALPWGLPITTKPGCLMCRDILHLGVFETRIPEAIWRLLDRGELAVDAGANIGQNTSLMALAAGPTGRVHAVEAHPTTHPYLSLNAARWDRHDLAPIVVHPLALGPSEGTARIHDPEDFAVNSGMPSLLAERGSGVSHEVSMTTLDALVGEEWKIGVLKLDVEGYELEVLRGAHQLLAAGAIRDIVFEDMESCQPSAVRRLLEDAGFSVFGLESRIRGPRLLAVNDIRTHDLVDYLATRDAARAERRFAPLGWRCLRSPPWPVARAAEPGTGTWK